MRGRSAGALIGVIWTSLLLASCSSGTATSSSSSAPPTSTRTSGGSSTVPSSSSTTTASPVSTTAPPASTTPTTSSTQPGGPTQCPSAALGTSIYGTSGAAGTIEMTIVITSAATCTLGGYPGLAMLNSAGAPLPTTVVRKGNYSFTSMTPSVVNVAPGQAAYFNLGYSDVPSGSQTSCPTSTTLQVTPPNSYASLSLVARLSPCNNGSITVSPVFAGTGPDAATRANG